MRRAITASILSAALSAVPTVSSAQVAPPATRPAAAAGLADVPVKQVVLYSSGVGYFEHLGTVTGDGSTELRFKTDQVNDVLKSLVLQDLDKGTVASVTYPSQEPAARALRNFQVDITANPPIAELLNQLRGAVVKLTFNVGAADVSGVIVGVERRAEKVIGGDGKPTVIDAVVLNLKVGKRFRAVPLADVKDFELEDPKLEAELDKALAVVAQARDQEKRPVTVHFRGRGERRVKLGYVVETPVWKTSYRLILGERKVAAAVKPATALAVGAKSPAALQGWAIVENQTDNDWADVQLSLVSGRPISFIQDLYQPLYVPRPVVFPNLYASLRPQTYKGGVSVEEEKMRQQLEEKGKSDGNVQANLGQAQNRGFNNRGSRGQGGGGGGLFSNSSGGNESMDPTASIAAEAEAAGLGELFQYSVGNVSLPRQQSAMIPIVTDDVEVQKVSIYNPNLLADHPLNGVRVRNTTGKHLLQGPVTVLEGGGYAGDARLDDVPPGQSRLLGYGVDLKVTVDPNAPVDRPQSHTVRTVTIVKGVITTTVRNQQTRAYSIQNKSDAARRVVVEHMRSGDWKVVGPAAAALDETAPEAFRLHVDVAPAKTERLEVTLEGDSTTSVQLAQVKPEQMVELSRQGGLTKSVKEALAKAVQLRDEQVDVDRRLDEKKRAMADVTAEQQRIRENLKTVAEKTDYYNRLLSKLNDQETMIEALQKESAALTAQAVERRKAYEAYVSQLNVDG